MSIVGVLSSLNILGFIAFLLTLGFLLYEIYMISKGKTGKQKIHVPEFEEGAQPLPPTMQIKERGWKNLTANLSKNNKLVLFGLFILLVFFGILTLAGSVKESSQTPQQLAVISPTQALAKRILPTASIPVEIDESRIPTISPTEEYADTIEPDTAETTASETETPIPTEAVEESATSPTVIEELPITSYVNNSIILFSAAAIFFFFAFLI